MPVTNPCRLPSAAGAVTFMRMRVEPLVLTGLASTLTPKWAVDLAAGSTNVVTMSMASPQRCPDPDPRDSGTVKSFPASSLRS